jgi:uncharacterized protein (UPF0548 family)
VFLLGTPSKAQVEDLLTSQSALPFSYPEVGATRDGPPARYTVDAYRVRLGRGDAVFERGKAALRAWRMFDLGWTELLPSEATIEPGTTVAVLARHLGFVSLNAARVVYVDRDEHRYGFAYGTLPGHAARGEERFGIVRDHRDGSVYYEVLAFSRPRHPLSYLGYPVTRLLQRRFARDSKRAMVAAVEQAGS